MAFDVGRKNLGAKKKIVRRTLRPFLFRKGEDSDHQVVVVLLESDIDDAAVAGDQYQGLPASNTLVKTIGIEPGEGEVFVLDNGASDDGVSKRWQLLAR